MQICAVITNKGRTEPGVNGRRFLFDSNNFVVVESNDGSDRFHVDVLVIDK